MKDKYAVWKVISSVWRCENVPPLIIDMFVIDHKENVSLINHKKFVNKQGLFFLVIYHKPLCYYSDGCQNVPWLTEEKDGCWVVDRAVVFGAGGTGSNPARFDFL